MLRIRIEKSSENLDFQQVSQYKTCQLDEVIISENPLLEEIFYYLFEVYNLVLN